MVTQVTDDVIAPSTANTLAGYNGSGNFSGVAIGTGLALSSGTLTATASGVSSFTGDGTVLNNSASTGAVTGTLATHTANTVLSGPASGSAATPTFRTLVAADIPIAATPPAYNSISGCLPTAISGTSTTGAVTISSGQAADSTNVVYIVSAGYSWAVSNGNAINGYSGGSTLPNSATIHFFLCTGASGTGTFASTSLTPSFPSGYAVYTRRIFSLLTNSSGALLGNTTLEVEGGAMMLYFGAYITDVSVSNLGTSRTSYAVSVPTGLKFEHLANIQTGTSTSVVISSLDAPDGATTNGITGVSPGYDLGGYSAGTAQNKFRTTTNTSSQIGARAFASSATLNIWTYGYRDFRRA